MGTVFRHYLAQTQATLEQLARHRIASEQAIDCGFQVVAVPFQVHICLLGYIYLTSVPPSSGLALALYYLLRRSFQPKCPKIYRFFFGESQEDHAVCISDMRVSESGKFPK
jgi:hypothetical protein